MNKLLLLFICFLSISAAAQDTTKAKPKEYLGVLTVTEKYKDEKNWTKNDQAIVGEHFQRLLKMKGEGVVVLAGRTQYNLDNADMMGIVIFYALDDNTALKFMMDDPAVKGSIMLAKVHPYSIAIKKCE